MGLLVSIIIKLFSKLAVLLLIVILFAIYDYDNDYRKVDLEIADQPFDCVWQEQSPVGTASSDGQVFDENVGEDDGTDNEWHRRQEINAIQEKLTQLENKYAKKEKSWLYKVCQDCYITAHALKKLKLEEQKNKLLAIHNSEKFVSKIQEYNLWSIYKIFYDDEFRCWDWHYRKKIFISVFFVIFFGGFFSKLFAFFMMAPASKIITKPIVVKTCLQGKSKGKASKNVGGVTYGESSPTIEHVISKDIDVLPGWYSALPVSRTGSRLFWDMKRPLLSYHLGLFKLVRCYADAETKQTVELGNATNPNYRIIRIDLKDHPGLVVKPGHIIAIQDEGLKLRRKWKLFDLRSWLYGRPRYVYIAGTGTIYVKELGEITVSKTNDADNQIKPDHVIIFDVRTPFTICRTETFLNYLYEYSPLYGISYSGEGSYLKQQSTGKVDAKLPESILEKIIMIIGKLFGL